MKSVQFSPKVEPLPGSLQVRYVRCGTPTCHCRNDGSLHGPYFRRFWREDGRTRSVYVPLADVPAVAAACDRSRDRHPSRRAVRRLLQDLTRLSDEVLAALPTPPSHQEAGP